MKLCLLIIYILILTFETYSQEFQKPEIVWENENYWEIAAIDDSTALEVASGKIHLVDNKWYYFILSQDYRFPIISGKYILKQNVYVFDFEGNKINENYYGLGKNPYNDIDSSINIRHFYEKDGIKYAVADLNPYSLTYMPNIYLWKLVKYTFDNDMNIINTDTSNFQSISYEYLEMYFDKNNKEIFYICEHTFYEDMTEDDETFPEPNEVLKIVQIEYSTMDIVSETYLDLNVFPEEENSWSISSFSINSNGNYILRVYEKVFDGSGYRRPGIYEFNLDGELISRNVYNIEEEIIIRMQNIYTNDKNSNMLSGISFDIDSAQQLERRTAFLSTDENGELRAYKDYKFNPNFEAFIQYTTSFDGGNTFYHFGQWRKYVPVLIDGEYFYLGAYINDLMYIVTDNNCNVLAMYKWDTYDETERIDRTNIAGIFDYDEEHFIIHSNFYPGRGNAEEKPFVLYMAKVKKYSPVSVEEDFEPTKRVSIFPNPVFDNLLHIHTTALITSTELTDILGRTVYKQSGNVEQISTAGLSQGLYLLKLYTAGGEVLTEKVVVR